VLDHVSQSEQVAHAQARPARRGQDEQIYLGRAGPLRTHATELARWVVVVDAVFTPGPAPVHQREDLPEQTVERVCDFEELLLIRQIVCS
jgi:hypothetical protein